MSAGVAIVGEGVLADLVFAELSAQYQVIRLTDCNSKLPHDAGLALVLHDTWLPSAHSDAEKVFRAAGVCWLRGFVAFGEGAIGPLVYPDAAGCSQCADIRGLMAGRDRKEMWQLRKRLSEARRRPQDAWALRTGMLQMAHILAEESRRVLQGCRSRLEERMLFIEMKTLKSSSHFFLPDPQCPV